MGGHYAQIGGHYLLTNTAKEFQILMLEDSKEHQITYTEVCLTCRKSNKKKQIIKSVLNFNLKTQKPLKIFTFVL